MRLPLCLPLLCLLAVAGCAASHPMTSEEFMGFCAQQNTGAFICDNLLLCGDFRDALATEQQSLGECLAQCKAVQDNQLRNGDPLSKCWYVTNNGYALCDRGCREKFKQ